MSLDLIKRVGVIRSRDDGPRSQMIPVKVRHSPNVPYVIQYDTVLTIAIICRVIFESKTVEYFFIIFLNILYFFTKSNSTVDFFR
jgi:hypothetical protein